ncbi:Dolichyl-diphosphooligosaccharide--protein glycosyltransferase subunit WBP1 [Lipomyces japonicus]|uniref:Dolichyl-diphosphooligosaccharide--protein glycosyltransferase subunit WBP1 n=1 Tax=Lipomyces japonicus TaxID=56871 RepID=UPI0034CD7EA6
MAHVSSRLLSVSIVLLAAFVLVLLPAASAISTSGTRTLVVVDKEFDRSQYSKFFNDLESRGYDLDIRQANDPELSLFVYDERLYDHLILTLPPVQRSLGPNFLAKPLLNFVSAGGNVLVVLNPTAAAPSSVRSFAAELDISLPFRDAKLVDHFSYDNVLAPRTHDVVVLDPASAVLNSNVVANITTGKKILYRGSAFALGNSQLVVPILGAQETAYTFDPVEESLQSDQPFVTGTQSFLVAGFQARNNARVVIAASSDLFANRFFDSKIHTNDRESDSGNRELARSVSAWAFQEKSVLRLNYVSHKLVESEEINSAIYRVKQQVEYTVSVSEYLDDKWVPYVTDDLQLEFTMLDPYYRLSIPVLSQTSDAAIYSVKFVTPDQHGMFTFHTNYKRTGLSYIEDKKTITLRHFGHNEFLRSYEIPNAWPYITSIVTVVVGWVLFVTLWVFSKGSEVEKKTT